MKELKNPGLLELAREARLRSYYHTISDLTTDMLRQLEEEKAFRQAVIKQCVEMKRVLEKGKR